MSKYILQPKKTLVERTALAIASKKFALSNRQEQFDTILSLQREDSIIKNISELFSELSPKVLKPVGVTGTAVVDLSKTAADLLRRELSDVLVIPDQPIELIRPIRPVTAAPKPSITPSDLWQFKAIGLEAARENGFTGTGSGSTIAVLDTGIDPTHPELNGKITEAFTFNEAGEAQPMTPSQDTEGHGTHVAGLICGKETGIAPGAKIISGVMIPNGNGMVSDFIHAIEWVALRTDVQIVNISAGIPGYSGVMRPALEALMAVGILPVCAVGNEGRNRTRSPGNYIEGFSVGATDSQNQVGSLSGGGTLTVDNQQYTVPDLVAPGIKVYSSIMGGGYEDWQGTSMAAPIVSATAALILEKYPNTTVIELMEKIFATCKDISQPLERQGMGLLQVTEIL